MKPQLIRHILLEGKIIGAVMQDDKGFFYRPKRNSILKSAHNPKWDGDHMPTLSDVMKSLGPLN